jgi:hypothetical protein
MPRNVRIVGTSEMLRQNGFVPTVHCPRVLSYFLAQNCATLTSPLDSVGSRGIGWIISASSGRCRRSGNDIGNARRFSITSNGCYPWRDKALRGKSRMTGGGRLPVLISGLPRRDISAPQQRQRFRDHPHKWGTRCSYAASVFTGKTLCRMFGAAGQDQTA